MSQSPPKDIARLVEPDISTLTGIKRSGFNEDRNKRLVRFDPCAYCGTPAPRDIGWEVDHIHARAAGGPNRWWNYTSACTMCNQLKTDNSLLMALVIINFDLPWLVATGEMPPPGYFARVGVDDADGRGRVRAPVA